MLIKELLAQLDFLDDSLYLFLPKDFDHLSANTNCLLMSDDEIESNSQVMDFDEYIGVHSIRDVIDNLKQQKSEFSTQDAVQAVDFYLKNDAFMEFES